MNSSKILDSIGIINFIILSDRTNVSVAKGVYKGNKVAIKIFAMKEAWEREVECYKLLSQKQASVPSIVDEVQIDSCFIMIQEWIDAVALDQVYRSLPTEKQNQIIRQSGECIAQIHFALSHQEIAKSKFWNRMEFNNFDKYSWNEYIYAQYEKWSNRIKFKDSDHLVGLNRIINDIGKRIFKLRNPQRITLLHCDFIFRNLLVNIETNELEAIIDFENVLIGDPLYDLAKITWVDLNIRKDQQQISALISGWEKHSEVSFDNDIFGTYQALHAIAAISWVDKQTEVLENSAVFRERAVQTLYYIFNKGF